MIEGIVRSEAADAGEEVEEISAEDLIDIAKDLAFDYCLENTDPLCSQDMTVEEAFNAIPW